MIDWKLKEEGFDKEKISYLGNKFLTGNGYMGVRGTLAEYGKENLAAINLAGIYDKVGDGWREPLNAPNGFYTYLVVDGEVLKLPDVNPEVHYTELDYRNGIFTRHSEWDTARGKITFDIERFVSMSDVHLGVMKFKVTADFHADVEVVYGIDGDVWDINGPHYDKLEYIENDVIGIIGTTHEKGYKVAVCGGDKTSFPCEKKINVHDKKVLKSINFVTDINKEYVIERFFGVYTSKDCENCVEEASKEVTVALRNGYEDAIEKHKDKWNSLWENSQVIVEGDDKAMEAVKMAVESPLLETTISGATHVIINISGDITLADASDAASYVQELAGDDVNIIFGAMYDESKSDSCTITVIATGLEDKANSAVQSRLGGGAAFRQPASHMTPTSLKGLQPTAPATPATQGGQAPRPIQPVPGIHKPTDIRSSVEEKSLKIPDFLQRK